MVLACLSPLFNFSPKLKSYLPTFNPQETKSLREAKIVKPLYKGDGVAALLATKTVKFSVSENVEARGLVGMERAKPTETDIPGIVQWDLPPVHALNLLKNDTTIKRGVKAKRKAAGRDNEYLVSLVSR